MPVPAQAATATWDIVVKLQGVSKTFRQRQRSGRVADIWRELWRPTWREVRALQDINLTIQRGEIVAYAGPNGAGKSTTIKLLAALLAPDAGTVRVLGYDPVRERERYVSHIGVVFGQRTELWWDHPVAASFTWKQVVWDIPAARYQRMLGVVTELLGLHEFFHTLARELSLGQRMRADLALALLHEPDVLFLDEPTLGLDVLAKRHMLQFLKDLNRRHHVTVILTSHDMADLEQLAERIVMIDKGRIAFDGNFDHLRRTFADRRHLCLATLSGPAPRLEGARWVQSTGNRHEYVFDASQVSIAALLAQATAQSHLVDVETHRAPIDDVIADIYERWQG
jgi:ABC-2 type transport system ATP-binding protein